MIKLAFCVITKGDEELESLKSLMESVKGVFQGVFITTNGKNIEKTRQWIKENKWNHSHLPWSDSFAEQRNYNFSQVSTDFDYIVWADSDDIIINAKLLPDIAEIAHKKNHDTVFFTYWYGNKFNGKPSKETFQEVELTQVRERLIKPGSIYWKKRLHESPVPYDGDHYIYSTVTYSKEYPIAWMHLGADRDDTQEKMNERMTRNQRLLELDLTDERKNGEADPRTILYLMKIYTESEDLDIVKTSIALGEEYMEKSGWDEERALCCRLMGICYGKLGMHKKANDLLFRAIQEYPKDPLLYLHLARTYYNLKKFSQMKHWMEIGFQVEQDSKVTSANLLEFKTLSLEMMIKYYYFGDEKNVRKAYIAAKRLNDILPTPQNQENENHLFDQKELDEASESAHKLMLYYRDIDRKELIPKVYDSMPEEMKLLPFAQTMNNKYKEPKVWAENEICYYATFGSNHFEQWSPLSIKKGLGGSETAVIELSKRWAKLGYKVTVYGDPGQFRGNHEGVLWLPYYYFNPRDKFNIFIAWRHHSLVDRISAKKYLVDLHDVFYPDSYYKNEDSIDYLMVKSMYHKNFAPKFKKVKVISNGI